METFDDCIYFICVYIYTHIIILLFFLTQDHHFTRWKYLICIVCHFIHVSQELSWPQLDIRQKQIVSHSSSTLGLYTHDCTPRQGEVSVEGWSLHQQWWQVHIGRKSAFLQSDAQKNNLLFNIEENKKLIVDFRNRRQRNSWGGLSKQY